MNTMTMVTLITTITALTRADSEMPIISSTEITHDDEHGGQVDHTRMCDPSGSFRASSGEETSCAGKSNAEVDCSSETT